MVNPFEGSGMFDFNNTSMQRIEAALYLTVTRAGEKYRVGVNGWTVDVRDISSPRCTCPDHVRRQTACKHIIAVMLTMIPAAVRAQIEARVRAWRGVQNLQKLTPSPRPFGLLKSNLW